MIAIIKKLNEKGFGFLQVEGRSKDLFFHANDVKGVTFKDLKEGDEVDYEGIEQTDKGEKAFKVRLLIN